MEFINVKLSDIGEVVGGSTPSTKNPDNYDGNIAWITPKDLAGYNKVYISKGERNITEMGFKSCSTKMLPKNSVLFSSRAPIGYVAISKNDLCTNQGFKSIIPNDKIDYKFLYYLLKHNKDYIASKGSGSTFKEVSGSVMKGIELSIPKNINDQKKISKVLFDIDKKIESNNEINNNLYDIAQLELLKDLKKNTTKYIMEGLFYHITPGTNYQPNRVKSGIPFLNVKNISNGYIDFKDSKYITEKDYEKVHKTWQPEENDLLISRIGTLGLVAVIRKEDLPLAVHYNFLDLKTDKIPFEFGYFLLKSDYFQTKYKFNVKNSVQEYVTVDDIRKIEVIIPDLEILYKYKIYYNKILNIQRENRYLEQLRDTLLPKLMNGEIDLDNIDI